VDEKQVKYIESLMDKFESCQYIKNRPYYKLTRSKHKGHDDEWCDGDGWYYNDSVVNSLFKCFKDGYNAALEETKKLFK
jgi:hypothetical protein